MGSAKMAARFLGSNAWPVYEGLCLDGVNEKPEYLLNLIKVLKDERPLKVIVVSMYAKGAYHSNFMHVF